MTNTKKLITTIILISIMLIAVITTLVVVLVLGNQQSTSNVTIQYESTDVNCEIKATYTIGSATTKASMSAVDEDGNSRGTTLALNINNSKGTLTPSGTISMDKDNTYVTFEYIFTNKHESLPMAVTLVSEPEILNNIDVTYKVTDGSVQLNTQAYANGIDEEIVNIPQLVPANSTSNIYCSIKVSNMLYNAQIKGAFVWDLSRTTAGDIEVANITSNAQVMAITGAYPNLKTTRADYDQLIKVANVATEGYYTDAACLTPVEFPITPTETTIIYANLVKANISPENLTYKPSTNSYVVDAEPLVTSSASTLSTANSYDVISATDTTLVIPDYYDGPNGLLPVTDITNGTKTTVDDVTNYTGLLVDNTTIEKVILGKNVSVIGTYFAYNCTSLKSIVLPTELNSIGTNSFYKCTSLLSVNVPGKVYDINFGAFQYCSALSEITIGYGVRNIAAYVFQYCSSLTEVILPDSIINIDSGTFAYTSASTIKLSNNITEIDSVCFRNSGIVEIIIPDSVNEIEASAFYQCSNLEKVVLSKNLTSLSTNVFNGCTSLKEITLPEGITSISTGLFNDCAKLEELTMLGKITSIGDTAFRGCSKLTNLDIGNFVTSIGNGAFRLSGLTSIKLPNTLSSIGNDAFRSSKLTSIVIPDSVDTIGDYLFYDCSQLISVTILGKITNIGIATFAYCHVLPNIILPDTVKSIGNNAFYQCYELTEINIPASLTSIGDYAFYACRTLTKLIIPIGVESIGKGAFQGCAKLYASGSDGIVFEDTTTWQKASTADATEWETVDVTSPTQNANWLVKTSGYYDYYWKKI